MKHNCGRESSAVISSGKSLNFLLPLIVVSALLLSTACLCAPSVLSRGIQLEKIKLPPGFEISLYTVKVPGTRSMTLSQQGTLFVGTRDEGKVYAVLDRSKQNKADEVVTVAQGLTMPNGVAFLNGSLYVAEISRVLRFDNIEDRLHNPPKPVVVNDSFPTDRQHGWKFIRFGPDGKLYVPIGAPCNICLRDDPRYASIMRMNADGTGP